MARLLGHRQTKGAATDKPTLLPPRHISTLPILLKNSKSQARRNSVRHRGNQNLTRLRLIDRPRRPTSPHQLFHVSPRSLKRASRLIAPRIFPSSVEKEFFNRIGRK